MPELPEVEVFRRFVERYVKGKRIQAVQVNQPKILQGLSPQALQKATIQKKVIETQRRGKQLFVRLENSKKSIWLLFHFGMTGYFSWFDNAEHVINAYHESKRSQNHIRVQFDLDDSSHWAFHEQRMFGKLALIEDLDAYLAESALGPDALDPHFDEKAFCNRLQNYKGQIKPVLLNQSAIAGIGNVYADEMLFQCKIHPERGISTLSQADLKCLYTQMKAVLQKTVDAGADRDQLPNNYLIHDRHAKAQCPRCQSLVATKTIGGRTTYFCPKCQR